MNGYIDAICTDQKLQLQLQNKTITVYRAKFREHLVLSKLRTVIANNIRRNMVDESKSILRRYFLVSGFTEKQVDSLTGKETILTYLLLTDFNSFDIELPFLKPNGAIDDDGTQKKLVYDYDDRQWATWVTMLAEVFGWSANDIYQMYPEEVACYVQEAIVTNYYNMERERSLSELSYKYDKTAKNSKFVPTPLPHWMSDGLMKEETIVRTSKAMIPVGNVIDLASKSSDK